MSSDPRTLETSYRWVVGSVSRGARLVSKQRVEFESFFLSESTNGKKGNENVFIANSIVMKSPVRGSPTGHPRRVA